MAERWFIVPMARGAGNRRHLRFPDYVGADAGPPVIDTGPAGWSAMDMPGNDQAALVHCPDIADDQAAALESMPGVFAFPVDLSGRITGPRRAALASRFGPLLGSDFDVAGMTHGEAVEEIMARLLACQSFHVRHRRHPGPTELGSVMPIGEARAAIAGARPRLRGGGR